MIRPRSCVSYGKMSEERFRAYWAGRWAAIRDHWMELAREDDSELRPLRVNFARTAHREAMRYLRGAS